MPGSLERHAGPYELWVRRPAPKGEGPCPLIAVGARANPLATDGLLSIDGVMWAMAPLTPSM